MSEHVTVETSNRVMTVTMNRPDKKNAINQAMYAAMADAILAYGTDDATRALVITGTGDMFSAGKDLKEVEFGEGMPAGEPPVVRFLRAIRDCPKPIIGAVNGGAVGIGLTMLLHCDLVYVAESARLSAPFASLGLVPEAASSILLPAAVGAAVANDIFMTGRWLSAAEALDFGLAARMFPDADFAAEVGKIAAQVAASAPTAMKRTKALVRHRAEEIATQMDRELAVFAEQLRSPEFAEVLSARGEKRMPEFG